MLNRAVLRQVHSSPLRQWASSVGRRQVSAPVSGRRHFVNASSATTSPESGRSSEVDVFSKDKRPVILFDGVCNFCNTGVNLVLSLDDRECFRFAALQSNTGRALLKRCNRDPSDISSMVVVEEDAFHLRSDAALKIAERLKIPFPLFSTLLSVVPKEARDRSYDWIAENRYNFFGKRDECRISDRKNYERFMS